MQHPGVLKKYRVEILWVNWKKGAISGGDQSV